MKTKIITYSIVVWFGLQALFMFYWPIYLYNLNGFKLNEMLALGCIILPSSIFFVANNKIIRKIATCLLWIYAIAFAFFGTLANLVASAKPTLALALTIVMIINIALLTANHFHAAEKKPELKKKTSNYYKKIHSIQFNFIQRTEPADGKSCQETAVVMLKCHQAAKRHGKSREAE